MSVPEWWRDYQCDDCGAVTAASGRPSYCSACVEWGTMRGPV